MHRIIYIIIGVLCVFKFTIAQQAFNYYPQQTGFLWHYEIIPLDSLNNQLDTLTTFRIDSFAVVTNFQGNTANLALTKTGGSNTIFNQPFTDSIHHSFAGFVAQEYFRSSSLGSVIQYMDSLGIPLGTVFDSFEGWYDYYIFNGQLNSTYSIFSNDVTVNFGGTDYPLRFEVDGKRIADETIVLKFGTFYSKKFVITKKISYLIIIPPFPPIPIEIANVETTLWYSLDNWLVKEYTLSAPVDLTFAGLGAFFIPGSSMQVVDASMLPVELTSFSASAKVNRVELNWQTATEINNYGFEIERIAENEQNWKVIGFVQGFGTSNTPHDYRFTDDRIIPSGSYSYRLKQIDTDGTFDYSKAVEISFDAPVTFELSQNYPNPFNPATTIRYSLPEASDVKLIVYDILGQKVKQLVDGFKDAGIHTINFNAEALNSGFYIYRIEAGDFIEVRKMTLLK